MRRPTDWTLASGPRKAAARSFAVLGLLCLLGGQAALAQDGTGGQEWDPQAFDIAFTPFADGFERPVFLADPNDATDRLFVVEQGGLIRIILNGEVLAIPFWILGTGWRRAARSRVC